MKFSYTNRRLFINLFLAILFVMLGLSNFFQKELMNLNQYFFFIFGIIYILIFIFELINKYFIIEDDNIKVFSIPPKKININELTEIKHNEKYYAFYTSTKKIVIAKLIIKKEERKIFDDIFNKIVKDLNKNVV